MSVSVRRGCVFVVADGGGFAVLFPPPTHTRTHTHMQTNTNTHKHTNTQTHTWGPDLELEVVATGVLEEHGLLFTSLAGKSNLWLNDKLPR